MEELSLIGKLALYLTVPLIVTLFMILPPRRAMFAAVIVGYLLLPVGDIRVVGLPDVNKITLIGAGLFAGVLLFDTNRFTKYRFHWIDVLMVAWLIAPFFSSISNEIGKFGGAYDGASETFANFLLWGMPYFFGRLYITRMEHMRELGIAILLGGLLYVPLCLYEMRMSPVLHLNVYGFVPGNFNQAIREGGYRPIVFLKHGLATGMWMTAASLAAIWLYRTRSVRTLFNVPMLLIIPVMLATTVMCRSTFSLMLLMAGVGVLFAGNYLRTSLPLIAMVLAVYVYLGVRATDTWDGKGLVQFAETYISENRAESLDFRFDAEGPLARHALEQPWFGWGGWNRHRDLGEDFEDFKITDSLWIIAFGKNGFYGLIALTLTITVPSLIWIRHFKPGTWATPDIGPGALVAVILVLHMMDNLMNSMENPVFIVGLGAITSMVANRPKKLVRVVKKKPRYHATAPLNEQNVPPRPQEERESPTHEPAPAH